MNRDTVSEGDETFTVQLSNPTGGETFAPSGDTGTGTIKNDDARPVVSFTGANNGNLSLFEGNTGATTPATFTVQLSAPSEQTVTVDVGLGAGTATLGTDFTNTGVPSTLTFAPGETSKTFSYSILGDDQNEAGRDLFGRAEQRAARDPRHDRHTRRRRRRSRMTMCSRRWRSTA